MSGSRNLLPSRSSDVYLVVRSFTTGNLRIPGISYLVLQACTSFLRFFRQKWRTSVHALFDKNAVAHRISPNIAMANQRRFPTREAKVQGNSATTWSEATATCNAFWT